MSGLLLAGCEGSDPYEIESTTAAVGEQGASFYDEERAAEARAEREAAAKAAEAGNPAGESTEDENGTEDTGASEDDPSAGFDPNVAGTLTVGGVDPALASKLKADPSAYAKNSIEGLVTFRMLSLAGVDIDQLLDYLFSDDPEKANVFEFPPGIMALSGQEAAVVGYMIPLEYKPKTDEIVIFMLVRDLMSCCFGNVPRPDEWIYVEMEKGASTKLYPYVPITVYGELTVGKLEDEFGFSSGVYSLEATKVEAFKVE